MGKPPEHELVQTNWQPLFCNWKGSFINRCNIIFCFDKVPMSERFRNNTVQCFLRKWPDDMNALVDT